MVSHNQAIVDILSCCFAISHDSYHLATREAEVPRYWISTLDSRKLQGMASSTSRSSHWLMNMMKPEQVDIWKYTRIRIETMLQREYYFLKNGFRRLAWPTTWCSFTVYLSSKVFFSSSDSTTCLGTSSCFVTFTKSSPSCRNGRRRSMSGVNIISAIHPQPL